MKAFTLNNKASAIILAAAFLFSRVLIKMLGVQFYGSFVHRMWQTIDLQLLKTSLIQSLLYSHSQPPLFNLYNGIVVNLFPGHYYLIFHLTILVCSFATSWLIYAILQRCGISAALSLGTATFFMINPAVITYENLYSYTMPSILLIALVVHALVSFLATRKLMWWIMFTASAGCLVLTRSSFHLIWMIVLFAIPFWWTKTYKRKQLVVASAIALTLVSGWYVKNLVMFGTFNSSSWLGMSMARLVPTKTPLGEVGPFKPVDQYAFLEYEENPFPDVAVLSQEKKSSGYINFNHYRYLSISRQFQNDVIREVVHEPSRYLSAVYRSFVIYFNPATRAPFIDKNLDKMGAYARVVAFDLSSRAPYNRDAFTVLNALPFFLVFVAVVILIMIGWRRKYWTENEKVLLLTTGFILAYGMLVGNLLEFGENNRFRFESHTVFIVVFVVVTDRFLKKFRNTYSQKHSM